MSDPDLEIRVVSKKFFAALRASILVKNKGERGRGGGRAGVSPGSATDVGR